MKAEHDKWSASAFCGAANRSSHGQGKQAWLLDSPEEHSLWAAVMAIREAVNFEAASAHAPLL